MSGEARRKALHAATGVAAPWVLLVGEPAATLALAAGVPLELVQRVTGHRTAEVVMKHYFRPGREDFRAAIFRAMPKMLADGGQRSVKEEMRRIIEGMTARTWRRDRERLAELLGAI